MSVQYGGDKITFADGSSTSSGYTFRNRIINGAMVIDQRNAGASVTDPGSNVYIIDRWYTNTSFTGTIGQNLGGVTPPTGFKNYFGMSAGSGNGVSNYAFRQVIEGYNVADLEWGTANAKTVTLSFWVRSSLTGTFGGSVTNYDQNRTFVFGYTITSANTWEFKSFVIPGDTTGTWNNTNSGGIHIYISQGCASAKKSAAGSWSVNDYRTVTGAVDLLTTPGATFYMTGVQLEVGSSATTFEYRDFGRELKLCQRYYETSYAIGTPVGADLAPASFRGVCNATYASSNYFGSVVFKEYKRGEPTVTFYTSTTSGSLAGYTTGGASTVTATAQNASQFGCSGVIGSVTNLQFVQGNWTANAEL